MSVGFLGIQFGWALQMTNTSAIYEYLGANPEEIPLLWLAAPVSGLVVQPLVGYFSDRTWNRFGRRHPYVLVGAIVSSIALIAMPHVSSLWMAAGLLWVMDTAINASMEPMRATVVDSTEPTNQQAKGFAIQSVCIGTGAILAAAAPWLLDRLFSLLSIAPQDQGIPITIRWAYYLGAAVFLSTVVWTLITTQERPPRIKPDDRDEPFELIPLLQAMPATMRDLGLVQFFTWLGIFCFFINFSPAIAHHFFSIHESSDLYRQGIQWAGLCFAAYNGVCLVFSLLLPRITQRLGCCTTHVLSLIAGGISLLSLGFMPGARWVLVPMVGFGIAWASTLSMPYAMLSPVLPQGDRGVYIGLFNAFITIPQIIAALGLGWAIDVVFAGDQLMAVMFGGFALLIAAGFAARIRLETVD
jgi:maltose/moltooligosaccharide transporter